MSSGWTDDPSTWPAWLRQLGQELFDAGPSAHVVLDMPRQHHRGQLTRYWQQTWSDVAAHEQQYLGAIDRLAQERAQLLANRLEGDTHQAWALQHPAYRGRLHVVHQLDGSCPPAVASFRLDVERGS